MLTSPYAGDCMQLVTECRLQELRSDLKQVLLMMPDHSFTEFMICLAPPQVTHELPHTSMCLLNTHAACRTMTMRLALMI